MVQITGLYAGLIALVFLWLSARVISYRMGNKISVGDAGDKALIKRMRAQANCAEYAPMGLVLLACLELQGSPAGSVHLAGAALFLGRLLHGWGFSSSPQVILARQIGTVLTLSMIGCSALYLIAVAIFSGL